MIESSLPQVAVLAFNEVASEVSVEAVGLVGDDNALVFIGLTIPFPFKDHGVAHLPIRLGLGSEEI